MFRSLRVWIGFIFSAVLVGLFFTLVDLNDVWNAFKEANFLFMLPAVVILFISLWIRCVRWTLLMRPVAAISATRLFPYAIIGYMANNLLPARIGELVRAWILGERERIPKASAIATIAVERLFDGGVLVVMFVITGLFIGFEDGALRIIGIASAILFAVAFIFFYWFTSSPTRSRRVAAWFLWKLPRRARVFLAPHASALLIGFRSVHNSSTFLAVVLLSAIAWTVEASAYAVIGVGFKIDLGFGHFLLLLSAANLAIILPTFFGGTGPFEWAARLVLTSGGIASGVASAYALVAHAVIFIPTTVVGLLLMWIFGIPLARLRESPIELVDSSKSKSVSL